MRKFHNQICYFAIIVGFASALPNLNLISRVPKKEGPEVMRFYDESMYLDNAYSGAGEWGIIDICPEASFATAIEIKYERQGHLDETAINGIKLYCSFVNETDTGYVTSSIGTNGEWFGMRICSNLTFVTGFRGNVLSYQGPFTDDVAVENLQVECGVNGAEIVDGLPFEVPDTYDFQAGTWSSWAKCARTSAVCGIQTRYEDGSLGDEVSIADIVIFCCQL